MSAEGEEEEPKRESVKSQQRTFSPASPTPPQPLTSPTSPTSSASPTSPTSPADSLNTEFIYYSAVLNNYAPSLSRDYDKLTTHLWMKKLFGPEYHPSVLKPKRNKYLLYLTITIYNDETFGIFSEDPPCGVLPELKDIPFNKNFPPAVWETEKQWSDTLTDIPAELKISDCYLHDSECPQSTYNLSTLLDTEFQFFLWLSRPYVALLPDPEDKTMAACWIQLLCGLASEEGDCVEMKELRNEYMQALLGYVHDLRVEGPFRMMPPVGPIPPLSLIYEHCGPESDFSDPSGKETEQFLASQPRPDNGAFAYINVTGELFGNN